MEKCEKWRDKYFDNGDNVITEISGKWNKDKIIFPVSS